LADIEEEVIAPMYAALTNNLIEGVKL
jgi:hypothetical protein